MPDGMKAEMNDDGSVTVTLPQGTGKCRTCGSDGLVDKRPPGADPNCEDCGGSGTGPTVWDEEYGREITLSCLCAVRVRAFYWCQTHNADECTEHACDRITPKDLD
jgi:hypothetical protein